MGLKSVLLLIVILELHLFQIECAKNKCYTAAVFEYHRFGDNIPIKKKNPEKIIESNLNNYALATEIAASHGSQIIVFSEDGIYEPLFPKKLNKPYLEEIPNKMNVYEPCRDERFSNSSILRPLSCMAKKNNIFIIAQMGDLQYCDIKSDPNCSSEGFYAYNTAIAFNNKGVLIAKYHKYHLFGEGSFDVPKTQEFVSFKTPFGVFGTMVCFDLIFKNPGISLVEKYNVNTIALPTWWFDEMPFLTAHQYQQSWAITNNVNLLAANINKVAVGSTGSGVYSGKKGAVEYQHTLDGPVSTLIIAHDLNIDPKDELSNCNPRIKKLKIGNKTERSNDKYFFKALDLSIFNHTKLTKTNDNLTLCQNGFCCSLNYSSEQQKRVQDHYFIVGNRVRKLPVLNYEWCEQMCAMVAYNTNKNTYSLVSDWMFDNIHLTAKFGTEYVYASLLTNQLQLVNKDAWNIVNHGYASSLEANNLKFVPVVASLYGRCYNKDPPYHYLFNSNNTV